MIEYRDGKRYIRVGKADVASIHPALTKPPSVEETHVMAAVNDTAPASVQQPIPFEVDILLWPYPVEEADVVAKVVYVGNPLGKARPRFTRRGRVYTDEATKKYEAALKAIFLHAVGMAPPDDKSRFALRCRFYRGDRQRIDTDNLVKAVSDAATGTVWGDDSQVVEVMARKVTAHPSPHAEVLIHRVPDPSPQKVCEQCGRTVAWYQSYPRKYCSQDCRAQAKKAVRVATACPECGCSFSVAPCHMRKAALRGLAAMFCSRSCASRCARRRQKDRLPASHMKCADCGRSVSKPGYVRCRACYLTAKANGTGRLWKSVIK